MIRKAIEINSQNAFYHNNLGIVLKEQGKLDDAVSCYHEAVEISPDYEEAHINMAAILKNQGKTEELIACYRKILKISPNYAEVYNSLGVALKKAGEIEEAIECYQKVLELKPDYVEAHINLGNALKQQKESDEAIACYRRALEIKPDYAEAYNNMGAVLESQGEKEEAEKCYRKASDLKPNYAEASHNLGNTLKTQGKLDEAIDAYRKATEIKPNYAEAYNSLGIALKEQGKVDEAIECYKKALEIEPKGTGAYYNMGNALGDQGKADEAVECYRKALEIKPEYAEAYVNMGNVLKNQGRIDESLDSYREAMQLKPEYHQAFSNYLFTLHYQSGHARDWLYERHCEWDEMYAQPLAEKIEAHTNDRTLDRRLRVGYVSPDFRSHSCAYFIDPLLRAHDKEQVEIFCYSEVPKADDVTERLTELSDHWFSTVKVGNDDLAQKIREDGIDILVDMAAHTANNRLLLFAQKPAPIQVTWLGYPDTTGMAAIDYRFTDEMADPEGEADQYNRETLVRLSSGFLCYSPLYTTPEVGKLPFSENKRITFASFNNLAKLSEEVVAVWSEILRRVPSSKFLLKNRRLSDESTQKRYLGMFTQNGISADRILMKPHTAARNDHMDMYNRVDIGLDPFPYSGTTTTFEAMWMGVPVLTIFGDRHVSRVGASIAKRIGLSGLIAKNEKEYIDRAVWLAEDIEQLTDLRSNLRPRMIRSPLCNAKIFARSVETAYREMWERYVTGTCSFEQISSVERVEKITTEDTEEARSTQRELNKTSAPSVPPSRPLRLKKETTDKAENMIRVEVPLPPKPSVAGLLNAAVKHHQAGEFDKAEKIYQEILRLHPDHPDALHLLGVALHQMGRREEAISLIEKAIQISPENGHYHNNLGVVLRDMGKPAEAVVYYEKALKFTPDYAEAHINMGMAYKDLGKPDEAIACFQKLLETDPQNAEAYHNIGLVQKDQGKSDEAIAAYEKAIEIKANYAEAYVGMGNALKNKGKLDDAMAAYQKALDINPRFAEVYNNLANAYRDKSMIGEAIRHYEKSVELKPNFAEAHSNMGVSLNDQGRGQEAIDCYQKALEIRPEYHQARSNMLFTLQHGNGHSPEWMFEQHRLWDEAHARPFAENIAPHANERDPERRLRVGYVSPDFRTHSCAYFLEPLFRMHDKSQVEIFCYGQVMRPDRVTQQLVKLADHWHSTIGKTDEAVAEQIRADGIDILVDLAGHTENNRLLVFAQKPAPVQVTWLGYPDTTGLSAMDYRLTDADADPEGIADAYASETLVRLPNGFLCYAPIDKTPNISGTPSQKAGHVTFGSFNNMCKVNPSVVAAWSEILRQVPGSKLLLKSRQASDESTKQLYLKLFADKGISADRIVMMPRVASRTGHLEMYHQVDIGLDPFPYNGTTTSFEAMWMGVPFVTLCGDRHVGRVGASILRRVGLEELVTESEADYIAKAVELAGNNGKLSDLRASLRQRMQDSPLCDAKGFAGSVENAYREMWRKWCDGGTPPGGKKTAEDTEKARSTQRINLESPDMKSPLEGGAGGVRLNFDDAMKTAVEHHQAGRFADAEKIYHQILEQDPKHPDALHLLGVIASQAGNYDRAIQLIEKAIQIRPEMESYHNNLGNAFKKKGKLDEAIACYGKALEIRSDFVEAYNNMGIALKDQGRFEQAIDLYKKAIEINPNFPEVHNEMGNALKGQGRVEEAIAAYQRAVGIKRDHAEAHNNMGVAFQDQGKVTEAIACYQKALEIRPDFAEVYNNLGNTLKEPGRLDEAIESYQKSLEFRPEYSKAHSNFLNILHYGWPPPSREWIYKQHCKWDEMHAKPLAANALSMSHSSLLTSHSSLLRVGYVSPDFCRHSCAYFIEPLLRTHDKTRVEVFCYAEVYQPDDITRRLMGLADHWYSTVGKTHADVAEQIRKDGIHILVDLGGHFAKNRLLVFAYKPAPVQVTWLGYPDTTGMSAMDYRFTDTVADPEGMSEKYVRETLVRLPSGFLCYDPLMPTPDVGDLPCLSSGHITFASFNNLSKVTEHSVAVWSEILKDVPDSRILLKSRQLSDASTRERYLEMFAKNGIPADRIILEPRIPSKRDHLALYGKVDIGLDPFPYNGTTTSCEALWMGVPVIALAGDRHVSRVGASILSQVGLTGWIAETEEDYIRKAIELAQNRERLTELRASLRERMRQSPLCDAKAFAEGVEAAYQEMWERYSTTEDAEKAQSTQRESDKTSASSAVKKDAPVPDNKAPSVKAPKQEEVPFQVLMNTAIHHHQRGQFDKAEAIYNHILRKKFLHGLSHDVRRRMPEHFPPLGIVKSQNCQGDIPVDIRGHCELQFCIGDES
ncbi:MAG: hypothetical protein B6245_16365 [Desulfobacteraceae bacterium 4572_88]|nr:MAG: hypothetical protein B6245_16365 [Desulfobacteraceae bacterium 4572_88]